MSLYQRHNYLNKNIPYIISNEIIEYDMQSAGFNLIKKYGLLDSNTIEYLESLSKKERQIQIGMYQINKRDLVKNMNEKFVEARKWFFEANELTDDDVLSIKKDAIITFKRCRNLEMDNIIFAEKNIYSSYYYLAGNEFYYNPQTLDVKGISDEMLELHEEFMIEFLHDFFHMNETVMRKKKIIGTLKEFADYYKNKELDVGYYRELNSDSLYRLVRYGSENIKIPNGIKYVDCLDNVDIGFNYFNYVIPLLSIHL